MTFEEVMQQLELLSNERVKKRYVSQGAQEPLFGVATGTMKPMYKAIKINQPLAEQLYGTGNYDAMYFAGMIADPNAMTAADYDRWMQAAYFPMLSDYVVAVTLSESDIAMSVADDWLTSDLELYRSAAWSCYQWLLGWRPDDYFDVEKVGSLLHMAATSAATETPHLQTVISNFIAAVGVSYIPLHEEALAVAGSISDLGDEGSCAFPNALAAIEKAREKGRIGFKRRAVRC